MEILSFDCNNYRLPVPRSPDSGDFDQCTKVFFVINCAAQQNKQIHRSYILPGQECEI
jgi:hypothetical protein